MKQIKTNFLLIWILFNCLILKSQNCYEVIGDYSGIDVSEFQEQLESSSCDLIAIIPNEFKNSFKIYDYGFYNLDQYKEGGFNNVWSDAIQSIPSEYYLIFGKESGPNGAFSKIRVGLKLPSIGNFECYNETQITLLALSVEEAVQSKIGSAVNSYADAEVEGINYLKNRIQDMIECCQPGLKNPQFACSGCPDSEDIDTYFTSTGYETTEISIIIDQFGDPIQLEPLSNPNIQDYANNLYSVNNRVTDAFSEMEAELENLSISDNTEGVITSNYNLCTDPSVTSLKKSSSVLAFDLFTNGYQISGKDLVIVYHIWLNPDGSGNDKLFKKYLYANGGSLEEIAEALDPSNIGVQKPSEFNYPLTEIDLDECDASFTLYEIKKETDGKYYGFEFSDCSWIKKDIVEFIHPDPFPANSNDPQYNSGSAGYTPSRTLKTKMRKEFGGPMIEVEYYTYEPCEKCYQYSVGNKKEEPINNLIAGFYGTYEVGWEHQDAKDVLFNSFIYGGGQPVVWNAESEISSDLSENEDVISNINRIENEITNWFRENESLNGLIAANVLRDVATNPNPNFTAWNLPSLWPFQMFGGIQGRSVKIVKFKEKENSNCSTNEYECEFVYTLYDNFGLNEEEPIWLPGMAEQWVLQHYKNYYCCNGQAFSPVTEHQVEFHHSFTFCK